jgi:multiple sugar transport system permease protein
MAGSKRFSYFLITLSFLLPALVLIGAFILWPTLETLRLSFFRDGEFVGLRNFQEILASRTTLNLARFPDRPPPWGTLIHNAVWILIHLPVTVILGIVLAVLFSKVQGWWVNLIKMVIFLGMVTPLVVGGVIIRFLFDGGAGIIPAIFRTLGIDNLAKTWTAFPDTALFALILGSIWLWTGFSMVLHSAGLSTIDKELYEAAELDGANEWNKFWMITIPLLWPVTAVVIGLTVLWELKIFDIVYVATQGGPGGASNVLALQMYFLGFRHLDAYGAATVATLLTVLSLPIGIWIARRSLRS